jgi:hypothetical protein
MSLIDSGIGPVADLLKTVIGKIWPDPAQQAQAQLNLATMVQTGELAQLASATGLMQGQIDVDKIEASSDGFIKSNWRPFLGWVCGFSFAWNFVLQPALEWGFTAYGHPVRLPHADMSQMQPVLYGMLGLGAMRSYDKKNGGAS